MKINGPLSDPTVRPDAMQALVKFRVLARKWLVRSFVFVSEWVTSVDIDKKY